MQKKRENSVKSLMELYTVVIGVALSLSVAGVIDPNKGLESVTLSSTLLFVAFLATLIPFYHGALRHLDDAYIESTNSHIKSGALIIDFGLLFLHAMTFVVLALLMKKPGHFAWILVALLTIDSIWGIFAHFASSSAMDFTTELKWSVINFLFIAATVSYLVVNEIYIAELQDSIKLSVPIAFICVVRTLWDYIWCRDFYFPK